MKFVIKTLFTLRFENSIENKYNLSDIVNTYIVLK